MKHMNRLLVLALAVAALTACKKEEDIAPPSGPGPASTALELLVSAPIAEHTVEVYAQHPALRVGYNAMYVRLKDPGGNYVSDANLSWQPVMTMMMGGTEHTHGCPYAPLAPAPDNGSLYSGYIVFNMASTGMGTWALHITFDADGTSHTLEVPMEVVASESEFHKTYATGMGTDGQAYFLAMLEPQAPVNGVNDLVVALFKRVDDFNFPVVDGHVIRVDPRMPGMGNHGAPGSEDMTQQPDGFYHGKAGFSMTGY